MGDGAQLETAIVGRMKAFVEWLGPNTMVGLAARMLLGLVVLEFGQDIWSVIA